MTDYILIFQCCVMLKILTAVLMNIQRFCFMMHCQLVKATDFWRNLCLHFMDVFDNLNLTAYKKGTYYFGIKVFNKLPGCINILSHSLKHFNLDLKDYFHLNSFYTLDGYFSSNTVWIPWFISFCLFYTNLLFIFNDLNSTDCNSTTYKYFYSCLCISNIQGVTGGTDQTSGECSLC